MSGLRSLRAGREDQPLTIEAIATSLIDAVREDHPRQLSDSDVKKAAKRRQRLAGGVGMFAGPAGVYIAGLYSEAEILCDVADRHQLALTDEALAAHLLVLWSVVPDLAAATAAIDGTGMSVAGHLGNRLRDEITGGQAEAMSKKDAVLAIWRLRSAVKDSPFLDRASPRDVLLPGSRVADVIEAAERQLGVAAG